MSTTGPCELDVMPRKRAGLKETRIGDELVISNDESKETLFLNGTARYVWQSCDGGTTLRQICDGLHEEFDVDAGSDLVADVKEVYSLFLSKNMIV